MRVAFLLIAVLALAACSSSVSTSGFVDQQIAANQRATIVPTTAAPAPLDAPEPKPETVASTKEVSAAPK